ncbi:MAG: hypothetical protein ACK559_01350, partial [bacterium]
AQHLAGGIEGADGAAVVSGDGRGGLGGAGGAPRVLDLLDDVGKGVAPEHRQRQQRGAVERAVARDGDHRGDPAELVVEAAGGAVERIDGAGQVADRVIAVRGDEVARLLRAAGRQVEAGVDTGLADLAVEPVVVVQRLAVAAAGGGRGVGGHGPAGRGILELSTAAQVAEQVIGLCGDKTEVVDAGSLAAGIVEVAGGAGPLGGQRVAQLQLPNSVAEHVELGARGAAGGEGTCASGGGALVVVGLRLDGGNALAEQVVRMGERTVTGAWQRSERGIDLRGSRRAGAARGQRGPGGVARHRRGFAEGVAHVAGHVAFGVNAVALAAQTVVGLVAGAAQYVDVGDRLAEG